MVSDASVPSVCVCETPKVSGAGPHLPCNQLPFVQVHQVPIPPLPANAHLPKSITRQQPSASQPMRALCSPEWVKIAESEPESGRNTHHTSRQVRPQFVKSDPSFVGTQSAILPWWNPVNGTTNIESQMETEYQPYEPIATLTVPAGPETYSGGEVKFTGDRAIASSALHVYTSKLNGETSFQSAGPRPTLHYTLRQAQGAGSSCK